MAVAEAVAADLEYLQRFGRGAALDAVRHRIQTSEHFPDMSETRTEVDHEGRRWVIRCLAVFANEDRTVVLCVGGDKARWALEHPKGPDWYDAWVPVADQVFEAIKESKGWT